MLRALKSIKQSYTPNQDLKILMITFKDMINHCIRIGLKHDVHTLKRLSMLSYQTLNKYDVLSTYKLNAISQACGRLSGFKRSIKKGISTKNPIVKKPYIINCYGFKRNGILLTIPYKLNNPINIVLNDYTQEILLDPTLKIRSFTITALNLSICISKEITEMECTKTVGIDRNLRNITVGNQDKVMFYKTNKLLSIKENTMHVLSSFRRNDRRIKSKLFSQKGNRRSRRVQQFLHKISKDIVQNAKDLKSMIVFEDLKGIRKLYRKGNGQGNKYRRRLNSWSFYELQRQVEYKAKWEGIPVRFVNPKRTSMLCPICGDRLQEDKQNRRKLLCINCKKSMDRDVVASLNIAYKGWARFIHPRDGTSEAMKGNVERDPLILRVDVSKSGQLRT